ncbi:MAG: 3-dehydroquinate synthase [Candidatus Porifericomitaceae bacterium WSBS_2022_MAG_OTU9]
MRSLVVELGERSYPIHIGTGIVRDISLWQSVVAARKVFILSDQNVADLHLPGLIERLRSLPQTEILLMVLPPGEQSKTLAMVEAVSSRMLSCRCDRGSLMLALGGGVVGDIAGFVAATYQRGIEFCQVPTTLLAQVDSSVGGKTGVNLPHGKNIVGAFHQPLAVFADLEMLDTLPQRQWSAGMAEVIKYGLINDAEFFVWLEENMQILRDGNRAALEYMVATSCSNKAKIVAADERETGQRALLNLGHTFGHAIEAMLNYESVLHGEAVAMGINMAADLSQRHGWIDAAAVQRVQNLLSAAGLPLTPPRGLKATQMIDYMATDKKVAAGQIRLVLLHGIGKAAIHSDYSRPMLGQMLARFCH